MIKGSGYAFSFLTVLSLVALGYSLGDPSVWTAIAVFAVVSFTIMAALSFKTAKDVALFGPREEGRFYKFSNLDIAGILRNQSVCQDPRNARAIREAAADIIESLEADNQHRWPAP